MQQQRPINYEREAVKIRNKGAHIAIPILMMLYLIVGFAYGFGLSIFLGKSWPMAIYFLGFPFGVRLVLRRILLVTFTGGWANPVAFVYAISGTLVLIAGIVSHASRNIGWIALYAMCAILMWTPVIAVIYFIGKLITQRRRSIAAAEHAAFVEALGTDNSGNPPAPDIEESSSWGIGQG